MSTETYAPRPRPHFTPEPGRWIKVLLLAHPYLVSASYGIRVNCVAPGLVKTPLTQRITGNETSLRASVAMHPLQRIGEPADVVSAIAWLADPRNGWITGQILGVDGGLGSVRSRH